MTKTAVETIAFVKEKLLAQNQRSENQYGNCVYRHQSGLRCGVGHLIPDDLYKQAWDEKTVGILPEKPPAADATLAEQECEVLRGEICAAVAAGGFCADPRLLYEIQNVHDSRDVADWGPALDDLAKRFA